MLASILISDFSQITAHSHHICIGFSTFAFTAFTATLNSNSGATIAKIFSFGLAFFGNAISRSSERHNNLLN
jgi:hypothetical protein